MTSAEPAGAEPELAPEHATRVHEHLLWLNVL